MNAVLFYAYENAIHAIGPNRRCDEAESIWPCVLAGMAGGVASVFLTSPTELIKIRAQCDVKSKGTVTEELKIARKLARMGARDGITRGMGITMCRDVPSFGVYFGVYELSCQCVGKSVPGMLFSGISRSVAVE